MSPNYALYLQLESEARHADEAACDRFLDEMDDVWWRLTPAEREALRVRDVELP